MPYPPTLLQKGSALEPPEGRPGIPALTLVNAGIDAALSAAGVVYSLPSFRTCD